MSELSEILEQLKIMNTRDNMDMVGIIAPIILSVLLIIQGTVCAVTTNKLQKAIHDKDRLDRYHDDIIRIYGSYYSFCDVILASGFSYYVETGNTGPMSYQINSLIQLKGTLCRNLDMARLLFSRSDETIYKIIEERIKLALDIADNYLEYVNGGEFYNTVNSAWETISAINNEAKANRGNYYYLSQNKEMMDKFVMLCNTKKHQDIQAKLKKLSEMHSYEEYDKYFERYVSLA